MTMPPSVARDPIKRREYLQKLCGLPDGQVTIDEDETKIRETCQEFGILVEGECQLEHDRCRVCGTGRELYRREHQCH